MGERNWVMAVDDDVAYLEMIEESIIEYYNVMLATSGKQALELLRSGKVPDLILLDIIMPGMDGYETYEHIYDTEQIPGIPVIFLTGKTNSEDEITGLKLGAQDYIMKPFVRENLLARIRLRLESSKHMRQLQILRERLQETDVYDERYAALSRELTSVEQKVVRLVILGCSNHEISLQLNYAHSYVKNLVSNIYHKLEVGNRSELWRLFRSLYRHEIEKIAGDVDLDFIVNTR